MTVPRQQRRNRQAGYLLLSILLLMALLMIAAVTMAPRVAQEIQRDREEELVHRGTQYARAIRRFYRKFGRYPMRLEELESTNNVRFLRKRYSDPITGTEEWRLIRVGQAKLKPRLFGMGAAAASPGLPTPGAPSTAALGGVLGQPGAPQATPASGPAAPGTTGTTGSASAGNQTFGGLPIIGVSSASEKVSIKEFDGKNHYHEWEFVYDPRFDPSFQQGGRTPGAPGTSPLPGFGGPPPPPATPAPTLPPK